MATRIFRFVPVAAAFVAAVGFTGCSTDSVTFPPDNIGCVFNTDTGELIGEPRIQGEKIEKQDHQTVVYIPASDRFWNINADATKRDAAASTRTVGVDNAQRETYGQFEVKFIIHPLKACELYVTHLRRNEPLDYNVEGNPNTGWQKTLKRNVDAAMQDAWRDTIVTEDGLVAALGLPMNANPDGTIPDGEVPGPFLDQYLRTPESGFGAKVRDYVASKLNGSYLCGPTTDVTDPNDCDPFIVSSMEPITMSPAYDDTISRWRQVAVARDQSTLAAQEAAQKQAAFDQQQSELDQQIARDNATREKENTAKIDELNDNAAVVAAQQKQDAAGKIAVCVAAGEQLGTPLTPEQCVQLLAVLSGQFGGGDVTVNAGGN